MLLLVPLMRAQSHQPLLVLSRRRNGETARRVPCPGSDTEASFDSDPFLATSDFVHDIRIVPARKYVDERSGEPLQERTGKHQHPDTSYYSQLSEINSCFLDGKTAIELLLPPYYVCLSLV